MKKIMLFFLIMYSFTGHTYAQSIYLDKYYIVGSEQLSEKRRVQIENISQELYKEFEKELIYKELKKTSVDADLITQQTSLYGTEINYAVDKKQVIFGRIFHNKNGKSLNIITYLHEIIDGEVQTKALKTFALDQKTSEWETLASQRNSIELISNKLFPGTESKIPPLAYNNSEKTSVDAPVIDEPCSFSPGILLTSAGVLIGGTSLIFRKKAVKIYDEDYALNLGTTDNLENLNRARKNNRLGHGLAAAGIITTGVGVYLWGKCSGKRKKTNEGLGMNCGKLQFTPRVELNSMGSFAGAEGILTYRF